MKISTGRIVEGKVVLEGEPLAEGSAKTTRPLTYPLRRRALLAAIAQTERGQIVSWEELREQLRRNPGGGVCENPPGGMTRRFILRPRAAPQPGGQQRNRRMDALPCTHEA